VFDFPVELEPPFRPFFIVEMPGAPVWDDGRVPTYLSEWVDRVRGNILPNTLPENKGLAEYEAYQAETNEPLFCQYYNEEFVELQLVLPRDLKIAKPASEQLLLSFSYAAHPVSFEVIGNSEKIIVQIAATNKDLSQISQQLKAHLPECSIIETKGRLEKAWLSGGDCGLIADFGLSNEFMLPLKTLPGFETDPLTIIIGALSNLHGGETGIFQVLFQKTRFDWAPEIISSVTCPDGSPLFVDAPEMVPLAKQKAGRPLFAAVVRVAARSASPDQMWQIVRGMGAGLAPLSNPLGNELIPLSNDHYPESRLQKALLGRLSFRCGMLLNSEELVSLIHPPSPSVQSEKLVRESARTKAAPIAALDHPLVLGENCHQNETRQVTLSAEQRTRHIHLIGASGSGKSNLMLNLVKQDFDSGQGLCIIDPHGDLIDEAIRNLPEKRINDVVMFDPSDSEYPIGFNILQANSDLEKTILSSDLTATFRRMSTSWGDVMDSVLANAVLAFVESERGGTLFELKRFLVEKAFRNEFLESVQDEAIRYFWQHEFPLIAGKPQASILIRLDTFLRQKLVRNIACQRETKLNFRDIMDSRKILLIKLSQGLIGEENAHLLGTLLVSKLYQTALTRQDTQERPYFWLYLDEFHHFITPSMEGILSGTRKYHLGLTLAHQEFRQLQSRNQEVASSVLSNCYTRICFRLGDTDAERLAAGFSFFDAKALQNLGVGEAIGRIGRAEDDFNLQTSLLPAVESALAVRRRSAVVSLAREKFACPRAEVESELYVTSAPPEQKEKAASPERRAPNAGGAGKAEVFSEVKPPSERADEAPAMTRSIPTGGKASDRGTQQHRYLQSLIKRMAENKGFRATIEKEVFGGVGKIDVALEDETRKIACEISVTNEPDYEVQNIRKCITAGYSPVVMISADARHLEKIRQKANGALAELDLATVQFLSPEEFYLWLENVLSSDTGKGEKIKGFKVNVNLKPVGQDENATKKRAISDVVFGALKRLKNKGPEA
jgi:hypothetical protein